MANQEQNPCNRQQFEGDEPQLGAPAQPSPSLPPPPPPYICSKDTRASEDWIRWSIQFVKTKKHVVTVMVLVLLGVLVVLEERARSADYGETLAERVDRLERRIADLEAIHHEHVVATATVVREGVVAFVTIEEEDRCSEYDSNDYRYSPAVEAEIVRRMDGRIYGPYSGTYFDSTKETDIEHIVARSEAHDSGMCSRSIEDRREFAGDLDNLTLAAPRLNRHVKVAKDAAEWLPEHNRCWYVSTIVAVKRKWRLSMDPSEAAVIRSVLDKCESVEMIFDALEEEGA